MAELAAGEDVVDLSDADADGVSAIATEQSLVEEMLKCSIRAQRRRDNQLMLQAIQLQVQSLQSGQQSDSNGSRFKKPNDDEDLGTATKRLIVSKRLRTPTASKRYQLNLSARFLDRVFTFAAIRSYTGWQAQILTSNMVPDDSEIFSLCAAGDVVGVRKLIEEGKASPLDHRIDDMGLTTDTFLVSLPSSYTSRLRVPWKLQRL